MNQNNRNILAEVLLELTLAIGSELDYQRILSKSIALWLRRLNCTAGAVVEAKDENLEIIFIIPTYLQNRGLVRTVVEHFLSKNVTFYEEYKDDREYHYLFTLGANRYFYFSRIPQLSKEQCNELFPVTQFFAKSLDNALEREKRVLAEKHLQHERHLLRTLIDHIPDPIYLKDKNLEKILANQADLKFTGLEKMENLIGKTDDEIYPPSLAAYFKAADLEVLETGLPMINRESYVKNAKGEGAWILASKYPFRDAAGQIIGLVGVSRDISNLKSSQENIKRLSLVASQTTNGVIITDVSGKVEWINDGFTRLSGYLPDEIRGKFPGEVLQGPDSDTKVIERMSRSLREEKAFEAEIVNYHKNGTPYWVHIHCNPLRDERGQLKGFMAIESDITERMIFNEELIRAKNIAEKAEKAEKTFLANMSHEIRTPLNAIIGMTSLLKDTGPSYEQLEYIETLDYSSKFLLRLINDILDLAKIESGKIDLKNNPFDLHKCLKRIYQLFQISAHKKGIEIHLKIDPNVPQYVEGDEILLQQALNNLVGNAIKFTERGRVRMEVDVVPDKYAKTTIRFKIIDSGVGIRDKDIDRIFQKFTQVERDNNFNRGTGLGLPITTEILELLGGKIEINSSYGKGTIMAAMVPFEVALLEPALIDNSGAAPFEQISKELSQKALVVEDNFMNQKYISRLLQKANIAYDIATNGKDAVDLCATTRYSFILMDIHMPIYDGFEATKLIRNGNGRNTGTPIIALTASALNEQQTKVLQYGMNDFLSKPFTPDQLHQKLAKFYR
ncbi:MAG: PAS domain-containing protein [Saprospiraceae bacterium]|nr:PAS domain-containing protein [Saprospiraceae bacterium]